MKTKIIAAASLMAVAVVVIAAIVVANPFGETSETASGEESLHSEGMAPLSANDGEESMHSEGMAPLSANDGEESIHSKGMAPLTVNIETEKRIIRRDGDGDSSLSSSASAKPYIGVAISETERGAVRVLEVLEDGPSNGVLRAGDVITAVDGETLGGSKDLVEAIADAGAGASLALTVMRGGGAADVQVRVGEFSEDADAGIRRYSYSQTFGLPKDDFDMDIDAYGKFGEMDGFGDFPMSMMDKDALDMFGDMDDFADFPMALMDEDVMDMFGDMDDFGEIARMEKTVAGEGGDYETHRMASGTVTRVDAAARTFTLQPQDGSAEITYAISEDAKTLISGSGGALGLTADGETPTLVMDVDGDATLIMQGADMLGTDWGK